MSKRKAFTILGAIAILAVLTAVLHRFDAFASPIMTAQETAVVADQDQPSALKETQEGALAGFEKFLTYTGFANATPGHIIMILVGLVFIYLAIKYDYEPLLLVPIGTGIIIGNIPFFQSPDINLQLGIYQEGSVLNYLYYGVTKGIYPPLIFLGIGAMTDFSSLISNPRLMLLGAAAQVGIFLTLLGALAIGFNLPEAASIGIIGGADGPTAIFLSSKLANGEIINGIQTAKMAMAPRMVNAFLLLMPYLRSHEDGE